MKKYKYIGNPDFIPKGEFPPRTWVDCRDTVKTWMEDHADELDIEANIAATFIVDLDYKLWIADRGSEHVACAREGNVLSAGEIFFSGLLGSSVFVDHITNQSTGYCPEPETWPAVARALEKTDIDFPNCFEPEFVFRLCSACDNRNVVKEGFFVCLVCDADLPLEYNVQ